MVNNASVEILTNDFMKFIKEISQTPFEVIDFMKIKAEQPQLNEEKTDDEKAAKGKSKKDEKIKENVMGIEYSKTDNFPLWYQQVLKKAEMLEYCPDVSGCYVLRPWSYALWEKIQSDLDARIKSHGVENAYFPMFVS